MIELAAKIGLNRACEVLDVPRSTVYRSRRPSLPRKPRPQPAHTLSEAERAEIRQTLNSERFMDKSPRQVYAALLDEGEYRCHWRSMYRILAAHGEVRERRNLRRHPVYERPELLATAPNQVWSWDITLLRGGFKGSYYRLYLVLDIFSRCVVGWRIAEIESGELARELVAETARKHGIQPEQLTLHADNGAPMRAKPLVQLLSELGITGSYNRPHTSNDNPFSEAQFKTLKYHPDYPERFADIEAARAWARRFITWYNEEHYHSGLNLLTPSSVHYGEASLIQQQRQAVMSAAYAVNPTRFSQGEPVVKGAPTAVYLNPPDLPENLS